MSKSPSVKSKVMDAINSGEVVMRPRRYFVMRNVLVGIGLALIMILVAIVITIVVNEVRLGQSFGLGDFGTRGAQVFISSFPWLLSIIGIGLTLAAAKLVRQLDIWYKYRAMVVSVGLVFAVVSIGSAVNFTGLNQPISRLEPVESLSTFTRYAEDHQIAGEVSEVGEDFITIETEQGQVSIEVDEDTSFQSSYVPQVGDTATAFGSFDETEVEDDEDKKKKFRAFGVKPDRSKNKNDDDRRSNENVQGEVKNKKNETNSPSEQ